MLGVAAMLDSRTGAGYEEASGGVMSGKTRKAWQWAVDLPALIIGVQILTKGWIKLDDFAHHRMLVACLLLTGAFVIVGSVLTVWLEKRIAHAHALFHAAEGMAFGMSAIILFEKGKLRMPLLLLFIGCVYLVLGAFGFLESRIDTRQKERLAALGRLVLAAAFLAAGILLAGFTAAGDRNVWAFGTSAVLAAIGMVGLVLLLVRRRRKGDVRTGEGEGRTENAPNAVPDSPIVRDR
jgi:hypothetical protein